MDNSVIRTKDLCDRCVFSFYRCSERKPACPDCENFNENKRCCNCVYVKMNTPCDYFKEEKDD